MEATFFETPAAFRAWLEHNHDRASELVVGFHRKDSGKPSIDWPQSVDQALCFGWIDGVRRRIDATSYSIRFTPRKRGSNWSAINIRRATELSKAGLMMAAGLRAFALRMEHRSRVYAYENAQRELPPADVKRFKAKRQAWAYFNAQPAGYRRLAIYWVTSAKRPETRERRLLQLIEDSAQQRRLGVYTLKPKATKA